MDPSRERLHYVDLRTPGGRRKGSSVDPLSTTLPDRGLAVVAKTDRETRSDRETEELGKIVGVFTCGFLRIHLSHSLTVSTTGNRPPSHPRSTPPVVPFPPTPSTHPSRPGGVPTCPHSSALIPTGDLPRGTSVERRSPKGVEERVLGDGKV